MGNNVSTYGRDTPVGHPGLNENAGVFVPVAGREKDLPPTIKNGAGIVGFGNPNGTLTIYFESNRFDESKLHSWVNKVHQSYDKLVSHAPTMSHMTIAADLLEQIGLADGSGIDIKHPASLQRWLAYCKVADTGPAKAMITWKS